MPTFSEENQSALVALKEKIEECEKIINRLPAESSYTKSLKVSNGNYKKKLTDCLKIGKPMSEEQKRAIAAIKSGKATEAEISALSARVKDASAGSNDQSKTSPKKSTKKVK